MGLSDRLVAPAAMGMIDRAAIASGIEGWSLMRAAGEAVAACVLARHPAARRAVVLAGPGNNGGDGYVAAASLARAGVPVAVFSLGNPSDLAGDAAIAFRHWGGTVRPLAAYSPDGGDLVVDALFGAGLSRPVTGAAASCIETVGRSGIPVVAVDLPTGVNGLTGKVMGHAFSATDTVTFFARKPGHVLMPGRSLCGRLALADIGIPARYGAAHAGELYENAPAMWAASLPMADAAAHKYAHGHLVVFSGPASATGAARLSAHAGLRAGAGLVTVASPSDAVAVNAAHLTAVMVRAVDDRAAATALAGDERISAFVLGPGFGSLEKARAFVESLAARRLVLDADGITAFADDRQTLARAFSGETRLVLTPHPGEFARLFPELASDPAASKVEMARAAATLVNAVVVLKGADSVIAAPDGRAVVNTNAPPWLATAGSGDVLAGIIGAFLAQAMPPFEAAAAGVWVHGAAAHEAGAGLTADDLPRAVGRIRASGWVQAADRK